MITVNQILSTSKDNLMSLSKELDANDLVNLVDWLSEKNDKIRYQSLLLLQSRMKYADDVYPYWEVFHEKLANENSYQRSIGLLMIAGNVKWDKENKFEELFEDFCILLNDEKPITVRQCIQSFQDIIPYKANLNIRIAKALMSINIMEVKETMRKLIMSDVIHLLILIRKEQKNDEMDNYISNALLGEVLDKKMKKNIEAML